MAGKVTLEVREGPLLGKIYTFEEHDAFLFGRSPNCHAQLPPDDLTVSRHHFILEVNPPAACIRDLGSRNGTYFLLVSFVPQFHFMTYRNFIL